jgi:hypothetical protein
MHLTTNGFEDRTVIRADLGAIFVSLELSRSTWLITSLSPGAGEKMSKHSVPGGDVAGLLMRLSQIREKARGRTGKSFPFIVVQEAGLDGFWIHRVRRPTGSTEKRWFGRCWHTNEANRASVRWSGYRRLRRRTAVGFHANARR